MTPDDFTELRGGLTLPNDVLALALDLEARGITLAADGDKLRASGPNGKPDLTPADVEGIKHRKIHLMALAGYIAPQPAWGEEP